MKSISILGVFVADLCFIGDRIPSKGQTILGKKHVVGPGGKGSNQAIAAARLNGEVSFITKVGKDSHSEMAFNLAAAIAWFDPFPPGPTTCFFPKIVWPLLGILSPIKHKSATKTPNIEIDFIN